MSQWRGQIEDIEEPGDVVELVGEYYHVPTVLVLIGFMLWSRVRDWENFVVGDTVYFGANDPWYHYRMVSYTVQNWPETSPFDPWTYFPYGTSSSQFGTIFDQIVATAALVVGLGSPSDHTIRMVALFAPVVFGVATAIPVYVMGRRSSNRFGGVVAVGVLALAGSSFAQRSTVGAFDHHVAEVFFQTVAILATMVAVSVAEKEKPVWELFEARDVDALRRPVGWALLSGVAIALYVWSWPPGVFLIGILGVYYLLELTSEYVHGESPEPVAITGAISLATAGILTLSSIEEIGLSSTSFNLIQPGMAFAVALGCLFLARLAREWDERDLPVAQYPAAVFGLIAVLTALVAFLLPDIFSFFVGQVSRVVGLTITDTAATVREAQPLPFEGLYDLYRFTIYIALTGVGYVAVLHFFRKPRAELTLLGVWTVFVLFATLTQGRFDYYLGVAVAVMTGMLVGEFVDFADLFEFEGDIENYQFLTIVSILLVVFAPLVYPVPLAMDATETGPGNSVQAWNESLDWMDGNTPEEGNLGGAGNDMPFYGTFERTEDYDYEEGFYGVMSWWDYGHWITTMGERIPTANPFQQGANEAANFLLSSDEGQANDVLEELKDGNGTETRYVMVDAQMSSPRSKYSAPFQFYSDGEISAADHYSFVSTGEGAVAIKHQPYYNTTMARLYQFHGSAAEPQPVSVQDASGEKFVVYDWTIESTPQGQRAQISESQQFDTLEAAREYTERDRTSQLGGIAQNPPERVPAMEQYRLVQASDTQGTRGGLHTAGNFVKLFERVPGATIEGDGPANTTVTADVLMREPASNSTFTYTQQVQTDEDGEFTMTVPYSTTGYDEWTTEDGYTEPAVQAEDSYRLRTEDRFTNESGYSFLYGSTLNVSEGKVIGEDDEPATVSLEKGAIIPPQDEENATAPEWNETESGGNETGTDGNETGTDGNGSTTEGSANSSESNESSLVEPNGIALDSTTILPLLGAGLVSLAFFSRRD